MIAFNLNAPYELEQVDLPVPRPAPGEALVRVKNVGICGSDLHFHDGSSPVEYPQARGAMPSSNFSGIAPRCREVFFRNGCGWSTSRRPWRRHGLEWTRLTRLFLKLDTPVFPLWELAQRVVRGLRTRTEL